MHVGFAGFLKHGFSFMFFLVLQISQKSEKAGSFDSALKSPINNNNYHILIAIDQGYYQFPLSD